MRSTLVKPRQFDKKLDKFFCLIMKRYTYCCKICYRRESSDHPRVWASLIVSVKKKGGST